MANFADKDNLPLRGEQLQQHIDKALTIEMPDSWQFDVVYKLFQRIFNPVITGRERIPDSPCIFIANHSLFALDGWILGPVMMKEMGIFPRGMGDRFLFTNERLADFVLSMGGVMGHPDVCDALMENGEDILVFPGGAHEAVKPARQMYTLQWRERYGFVRLAAKHGYTIQPFGIVGPDEFYDHLIEGEELPDSALGPILRRLGLLTENTRPDMMPPLPLGALGTLLPKPQRCYIGFAEPLDLAQYQGRKLGKRQLHSIREDVAARIEQELSALLLLREQRRRHDGILRRVLTL
ncbi:MAG: lysophospholipid acyltransferase family protein [Pseudomonadota bacterium]